MEKSLKLFISYCHEDEKAVNEFIAFTAPFHKGIDSPLFTIWYDRKLKSGGKLWGEIFANIKDIDVAVLFISANYLNSGACITEKNHLLQMQEDRGILVLPLILETCLWLEDKKLSSLLALTTDGKPLNEFSDRKKGFEDISLHLKSALEGYKCLKFADFSTEFRQQMEDMPALTKSHGEKEHILLSDVFIYPDLSCIKDSTTRIRMGSENVVKGLGRGSRVAIIGEDQSGKTSLAYVICQALRKNGFMPVYVRDEQKTFLGKFENRISKSFAQQYGDNISITDAIKHCIIPIVDDVHLAKRIDGIIAQLEEYTASVIIVDGIFAMDPRSEAVISSYDKYQIQELSASLRAKLINKWIDLSDKEEEREAERREPNARLRRIDKYTQYINDTFGKMANRGIMPSYPFFVLFTLSTYETLDRPLEDKITSQGYCYQALIYFCLRQQGVANDEIDTYINFLTEYAFEIYNNNGNPLTDEGYNSFVSNYQRLYNFQDHKKFEIRLKNAEIVKVTSAGNYGFSYPCLYYYFAGKKFAEFLDNPNDFSVQEQKACQESITHILANLHKNDYAYIAVFIGHHTRNRGFMDSLIEVAQKLFADFNPCTLTSEEVAFFSMNSIDPPLLSEQVNPEANRQVTLKHQDEMENKEFNSAEDETNSEDEFSRQLRSCVKTAEVIGRIARNRSGSIQIPYLESMIEKGMEGLLRMMASFFDLVKQLNGDPNGLTFLKERLEKIHHFDTESALDDAAVQVFWNLNFGVVFGIISRICSSFGSDSLMPNIISVCDRMDKPVGSIIKARCRMWYRKNIDFDEISYFFKENKNNQLATRIMAYSIAHYCSMHYISDADRNRLLSIGFLKRAIAYKGEH